MKYENFTKEELIAIINHKDAQLKYNEKSQLAYNGLLHKYKSDYTIAIHAAVKAGEAIMKVYNSDDFGTMYKDDATPVTHADKEANGIINLMLNPHIPILSEEGKIPKYRRRKKWGTVWIVDPLDGTKEFVKKGTDFTVNIALVYKGTPLFGVIYVPFSKTLYVGIKTVGSYKMTLQSTTDILEFKFDDIIKNSTMLPILDTKRPRTLVATKSHMNKDTKNFIDIHKRGYFNLKVISKGSSLKFCAVAEGSADVYPRFGPTMEWDTAAGQAIVEAAGGKVLKIDSTELIYNKENLLNDNFIVSMEY